MNNLISAIIGLIIAFMVLANGVLSGFTGLYLANAIIHGVGLITIGLIIIIGRHRIKNLGTVPLILYAGGLLGISNVLLNSFCFSYLGVSLTLTLGQAGQFLASALIDHYGLFGLKRIPFVRKKIWGFAIIGIGLIVMMFE